MGREVRIDPMTPAPLADAGHDLVRRLRDAQALGRPVALGQEREVLPPAVQEPAIAAAGAAAADIRLEQDDAHLRGDLAQEVGGPHPRVAAADDRDVGGRIAEE